MPTHHTNPPKKSKKYLGFTLVELIVVITILVILGTIAFLNLGGFAGSSRDSARISNLANLQKGLNVYQVKTGTYPTPESSVAITASGVTIGYQGFAKDIVGGIAKISKGGTVDPADSNIYTTYAVNQTLTKMQAMVFLEDSTNVTAWNPTFITTPTFIPTTYAATTTDYSKRFPKTSGDTLGILLSTATGTLNQPVQETGTGVDVVLTNTGYAAVFSKNDTISGTGEKLFTNIYNRSTELLSNKSLGSLENSLIGYWDMETMTGTKLQDLSGKGNNGSGISLSGSLSTMSVPGMIGKSVYLSGDTDRSFYDFYTSGTVLSNLANNKDFSIEAIIKDNYGSGVVWGTIASTYQSGPVAGWNFRTFSDATGGRCLSMQILNSNGNQLLTGIPGEIKTGNWYFVTATYSFSQGLIKLYINGNESTQFLANSKSAGSYIESYPGIDYNSNGLDIGKVGHAATQFWNGNIDDVKIYNRSLSDLEVKQHARVSGF